MSEPASSREPYRLPQVRQDLIVTKLIRWQAVPVVGRLISFFLRWNGIDFPPHILVGGDPVIMHAGVGVILSTRCRIGSNVVFTPFVQIGRSDAWGPIRFQGPGVIVEDDVYFGTKATVLYDANDGPVTIGRGAMIGAGAVVTQPVGPYEIWAGNPARKVGMRNPEDVPIGRWA